MQEIAARMKTMKKCQTISLYVILGCVWVWIVAKDFVKWGFGFNLVIMAIFSALIIFVAYKLFLRSRNGAGNDFDDMISQLENFQQTDL